MCIIIASYPTSSLVSTEVFNRCADNNGDGFGIMWPDQGRVKIWKTMHDVRKLYDLYYEQWQAKRPAVIHFRWATHGSRTIDNVHPFHVPNTERKLGFAHNGVLDVPSSKEVSDTRMFGRHVLAHLPAGWRDNAELRACYEDGFLGSGNKIVTLDHDGRIDILNERLGVWHEGVWYSNDGFQQSRWAAWQTGWHGATSASAADEIVAYRYGGWAMCAACCAMFGDDPDLDPQLTPLSAEDAAEFEECVQCEAAFVAPKAPPAARSEVPYESVGDRVRRMSVSPSNPIDRLPGEEALPYLQRRREAYLEVARTCEERGDAAGVVAALGNFQSFAASCLRLAQPNVTFDPYVTPMVGERVAAYVERRFTTLADRRRTAEQKGDANWQPCVHGVSVKEFCVTCNSTQYAPDTHGTAIPA